MYEAPFCCTMHFCEGLSYIHNNIEFYNYNGTEKTTDNLGRRFIGDVLLVKDEKGEVIPLDSNLNYSHDKIKDRVLKIVW